MVPKNRESEHYQFLRFAVVCFCVAASFIVVMATNAEDFNLNEWVTFAEWLSSALAGGGLYHLVQSYLKE